MKSQKKSDSLYKIKFNFIIIIQFVLTFFYNMNVAKAQSINSVQVLGSLCNQKNTSITITPDGQALTVLFEALHLNFPNANPTRVLPQITDLVGTDIQGAGWSMIDHQFCLVQLEIKESSERITGVQILGDARGVASVPRGFKGSFKLVADYETGLRSPTKARGLISKQYFENVDDDFTLSFDKKLNIVGSCRPSTKKITVKVLLGLSKNVSASGDALLALDSLDKTISGFKLAIHTATCL